MFLLFILESSCSEATKSLGRDASIWIDYNANGTALGNILGGQEQEVEARFDFFLSSRTFPVPAFRASALTWVARSPVGTDRISDKGHDQGNACKSGKFAHEWLLSESLGKIACSSQYKLQTLA